MFFRSYLLPILSIILAIILSFSAIAETESNTSGQGIATIILQDASDVPSAVAELTSELERKGFTIPLTVNHSAAAADVKLDLNPNQVIFARPPKYLERRLLRKSNTIGLDLPFKFSVFEGSNGAINLSVNTIGYLIDRHKISIRDFVLRMTDKLIEQFGSPSDGRHGLISVESSQSVEDTVQTLLDAISNNPDARIPLILEYGNNNTGQKNKRNQKSFPKLIIFGNPNVGTLLMQANPQVAIDLPQKFLVWKDENGNVSITYNDPLFIAGRVNLQGQKERLNAIANNLKNLAEIGAGGIP